MEYKPLEGEVTEEDLKRFYSKTREVYKGSFKGCIEWTGAKVPSPPTQTGIISYYGRFAWNGRTVPAHRFALYIVTGKDPGPTVDHRCYNTLCVNPDPKHLIGCTIAENNANIRTRLSTFCRHGHERTEESTYINPTNKRRSCRECDRIADKSRYAKKYAKEKQHNTHSSEMRDFARDPKLDWDKVREIRRLSSEGKSQRWLARLFCVSQPMIGIIVRGESWVESTNTDNDLQRESSVI